MEDPIIELPLADAKPLVHEEAAHGPTVEALQAEIEQARAERNEAGMRFNAFEAEHEALIAANEDARRALAGRLRESFLATDAALDPAMVQGETLEELEASFASAQALVAKVREIVVREQERTRPAAPIVPAGAPGRTRTSPTSALEVSGSGSRAWPHERRRGRRPRFPGADWVPWQLHGEEAIRPAGRAKTEPMAAVLHIMAGYAHTARDWATAGHVGASWHFTVARDGSAMQHLELSDAGWHAGIPADAPTPPWTLWRGPARTSTATPSASNTKASPANRSPLPRRATSIALCRWLATTLGFPFDRAHFPAHADIDIINRPNDFNTPPAARQHYAALLGAGEPALAQAPGAGRPALASKTTGEVDMTPDEVEAIAAKAAEKAITDAFETALPNIFRRLVHAYWLPASPTATPTPRACR